MYGILKNIIARSEAVARRKLKQTRRFLADKLGTGSTIYTFGIASDKTLAMTHTKRVSYTKLH
ncbi:hypothetical protein KSU1_C0715 [Candidatus Jettenia caeni]|uniref:Uncharacterized protein n=2 Tax=Candidatus Jettenia TaxID=360731 RepID=I3IKR6_9BACT|nr:hypothetical protein KSU1_C0715 [Candidatus Jettenia caeni]